MRGGASPGRTLVPVLLLVSFLLCAPAQGALDPDYRFPAFFALRVSVADDGSELGEDTWEASPVLDGRYVAFSSRSSQVVAGDTNGRRDIFVRDLVDETTLRVSLGSAEEQANGDSDGPSIAEGGRYIAFRSNATNLFTPLAPSGVYVRDQLAGTTTRVDVSYGGPPNGPAEHPLFSADARILAFESLAGNLINPLGTASFAQVYAYDLENDALELVSAASDGGAANGPASLVDVSTDGRFILFFSDASNLGGNARLFLRDRTTLTTHPIHLPWNWTATTERVAGVSDDGRFVVLSSNPTEDIGSYRWSRIFRQIVLLDRETGGVQLASQNATGAPGMHDSRRPRIDGSGHFVAFESRAPNLGRADDLNAWDVYAWHRISGELAWLTPAFNEAEPRSEHCGKSWWKAASLLVGFDRAAKSAVVASPNTNFVEGDSNERVDIFATDLAAAAWGIHPTGPCESRTSVAVGPTEPETTTPVPTSVVPAPGTSAAPFTPADETGADSAAPEPSTNPRLWLSVSGAGIVLGALASWLLARRFGP